MLDDELSFTRNELKEIDIINENDIERSNLNKDADEYSEREITRELCRELEKKGWKKLTIKEEDKK